MQIIGGMGPNTGPTDRGKLQWARRTSAMNAAMSVGFTLRPSRAAPGAARMAPLRKPSSPSVTSTASERSYAPLTEVHLGRLSDLADEDHRRFTRPDGRPEYRDRRVAVVLAQGGALHFVDEISGVKDLDVWTFYAAIPDIPFLFGQRKLHVDFGISEHGRNKYPPGFRHPQLKRWLQFHGRRVVHGHVIPQGLPSRNSPGSGAAAVSVANR